MKFQRVKLLSGMLSAAALASVAGAPVLAAEMPEESLSLTSTLENQEDEAAPEQSSVAQFLDGNETEAEADKAAPVADLISEEAEKEEDSAQADSSDVMIPMALPAEESEKETEDKAEESGAEVSEADAETAENSDDGSAAESSDRTDTREVQQAAAAADTTEEAAIEEAVQTYNDAVLPELTVALEPGDIMTGVGKGAVAEDMASDFGADRSARTGLDLTGLRERAEGRKIVVASPNVYLNIHAEPSMGSDVLGKMYSNDLAIVLRKENDRWTRIRSGNIVGYVMNEYLVEGSQAEALSEIVSTQVATIDKNASSEIYQEANDYSKIIGEAEAGDQYEVTESEDGWLGIITDDGEGYIPSSEVTLSMAYPVAESARAEADRVSRSNVKERADHEQRKADKADAVARLAQTRADVAGYTDEETAMAVVEVALRAADAAAAQADVAQVAVSQAGEESGQAVIEFATQFIGNPYVWGGSSLTHGADCSGFVMAVYGNFGFRLPHYDVSDRSVGSPVASLSEARAGDIVCYNGHVALYMGDGMIVHAQDERHGITTSRADFMHIVCIRRLFN